MRRILLPLILSALVLTIAAPAASASLFGVESNGELSNSSVTPVERSATLDKMQAQGVRIVRVNFGWNETAVNCEGQTATALKDHENPCYDWSRIDDLVMQANARGMQVLISLTRTPTWVLKNSDPFYVGTRSSEWLVFLSHYEAFIGAAATRYKAGSTHGFIRYWTVWNEPNSSTFFKPMTTRIMLSALPKRYAQLLGRSAVAIKTASPSAFVAAGPTGPKSTIKPITFIKQVQAVLPLFLPGKTITAKRRWVNAWAHNPYPGATIAPGRGYIKSPSVGMTNIRDLFKQLDTSAYTRGLPMWATEFSYETNPPDNVFGVAPHIQGRFMAEAFDWLDSTSRVSIQIWYGFTDSKDIQRDWQSGTFYANGMQKPSFAWFQRPISVPLGIVRRGTTARVWARSTLNPAATRIAYSYDNKHWKLIPTLRGRKYDGTTIISIRVIRTIYFATWDGTRGPARVVLAR